MPLRNLVILGNLAGPFGFFQQFRLKARIGDIQQGDDHFLVRPAAQVGDAVFSHYDIAQMAGNRDVAVVPDDVRTHAQPALTSAAQHQDGAGARQFVGHRHEVVLTAYAADHLTVLQAIGHRRTH